MSLQQSLAEAFATLAPAGPGLVETRRQAAADAVAFGLPGAREERWKYSPLRALAARRFAAATQPATLDAASIADIPAPRLVLVNGTVHHGLSDLSGLPTGIHAQALAQALQDQDPRQVAVLGRRFERRDEVFALWNAALAADGALVRVEAGVHVDATLHLVHLGVAVGAEQASHTRHLVELGRDASLRLVEHWRGAGEHRNLANSLTHVHLAAGARLQHLRLQQEADGATLIQRSDAVLARDARLQRLDLDLGGAWSRHELNVRLEGENSVLQANGVLLADQRRHFDTRLGIEHIARDTACDLLWRGLASGRGHAVFHGGITIRAGADGANARLANKNLLLSDQAEIDTQPVLEIHADEVQAAHGATVGRLDAQALFYLRSRGLPEAQARTLLTGAFCREAVAVLEDTDMRNIATAALDLALSRLQVSA